MKDRTVSPEAKEFLSLWVNEALLVDVIERRMRRREALKLFLRCLLFAAILSVFPIACMLVDRWWP